MSGDLMLGAGETFSEWVERVWQARRERGPRGNDGPASKDNGAGETAPAATLEQAIKERAIKWMEEGQFLVGLLQELLDENEQLRAKAAALERDVQRLHEEKGEIQPERKEPERKEIVEVAPKGALDMASATEMKLQDHLNAGKTRLVLDLEGVEYIDSAGLGEIVRAMKRAREVGGDLRLWGLREDVLRIFEITGLNKAFAIYPTREEAVASWS
ncbi:MAG: STAS domain-containing protein [Candidatus Rokubacteria bacterium]|nr:STAS domain-containing protein [Candidatus Rokubacteria bacterium]MBI2544513.1 STAS domain-containing protein [Candidatus Rokubacteria bacterium]